MPDLSLELEIFAQAGAHQIAGLDEAGRGALAGPVVAAAVLLPLDDEACIDKLRGVDDSKVLTARQRDALYDIIVVHCTGWGVGITSPEIVDGGGILPATRLAMTSALRQLLPQPQYLLIDGRIRLAHLPTPQRSVVRGDGISLSIAAASILAKVTRDRIMVVLDAEYPDYGFARHKGYGTPQHLAALA